jgi:LysR family transcriptional regulator, glycine cleavage system transcriptional activator
LSYSPLRREEKSPMAGTELPPLNAVRAFEAAARRGSFVEAAADLHVTHWAVGKQIRLLEDWFGVPLFERRPRGVALTDEGTQLLEDVSAAFSHLALASRRLKQTEAPRPASGVVRISVPTSFALRWLIPRLSEFQDDFPNIDVRISTTSRKLRYIGTAFDLGVRFSPEVAPGLKSYVLMNDWHLPACSPGILHNRPVGSVDDLRRHTLLHSSTTLSAWPQWLAAAGRAGLTPTRHIEFGHVHLQLQAAVEGLGIAIASKPLIERDIAAGRLVCPISNLERHAGEYILVSEDREPRAAIAAFGDWIMSMAASRIDQMRSV